jgi:hypothetical protein
MISNSLLVQRMYTNYIRLFLLNHIVALVLSGGGDEGPEPRLRFALQPLGLLYNLFSRSSHCRRQMSPRPKRRERSEQREVELNGRERVAENFA